MIHRPAIEDISPATFATDTYVVMLLSEDSTAAPALTDRLVSDLVPAVNELVCTGYARIELAGAAATWDTDHVEGTGDNVNFGALVSEHAGHGVSGVAVYLKVGDGSDDTANLLVKSWTVDPVEELDGTDVVIGWDATGLFTWGAA